MEEDSVRVVVEGEVPVEVVEAGVIDGIVDFACVALVHYLLLIFCRLANFVSVFVACEWRCSMRNKSFFDIFIKS